MQQRSFRFSKNLPLFRWNLNKSNPTQMSCGWERTPDTKLPFRIFRFSYLQIVIMVGLNTNIDEYWWILITRANCWPAPDECSTVSLAPCSLRIPPDKSSLLPPPSSRRKGSGRPSSMSWFLILLLQGEHRVILWVENWSPLWSVRKDSPPLDQERPRQKRFFRCVIMCLRKSASSTSFPRPRLGQTEQPPPPLLLA